MGRWAGSLILTVFVAGSGYLLGQAPIRVERPPARPAASVALAGPLPPTALMSLRDRPHPHGLEDDDRDRWTPRWGPLWRGGGRHPVWRGCRRVYDPAMNAFLNAPGPVPTVSGA